MMEHREVSGDGQDGDDSVERVELLRKKIEIGRRLLKLSETHGLLFYRPHEKQEAFHRAGAWAKRRMIRSGNRFGKSTAGMAEDCAWLLNERIWMPEDDPDRIAGIPRHPVKGLVLAADWEKVHELFTSQESSNPGKLWQLLPRGSVKEKGGTRKNSTGVITEVILKNGSSIRFDTVKSFKQDPSGAESSDWDFIHVDEPVPEDLWKAHSRGLIDRGGAAWFTLTPLSEFWINDMFFPREAGVEVQTKRFWSINGSTYDNPFLSVEDIQEFERSLTAEERECRINGLPLELSGLVYKEFSYEKHVLKRLPEEWVDWNEPPLHYTFYVALDPHPQTPHAALFLAVDPTGKKFVYDELWTTGDVETLASELKRKINSKRIASFKCDPWVWNKDPISGSNFASELAKHGVYVEKASKEKSHGILTVRRFLKTPNVFFVAPNLNRFLFEINRYCYDRENKPIDKDDHMMENLYRLLINDPGWIDWKEIDAWVVPQEQFAEPNLSQVL